MQHPVLPVLVQKISDTSVGLGEAPRVFANTPQASGRVVRWLEASGRPVRIGLEATVHHAANRRNGRVKGDFCKYDKVKPIASI
jgi:hypothetical protein